MSLQRAPGDVTAWLEAAADASSPGTVALAPSAPGTRAVASVAARPRNVVEPIAPASSAPPDHDVVAEVLLDDGPVPALLAPLDRSSLPPVPPTWRRVDGQRSARGLVGAGLGLYGLRRVPLVGREDERDALWSTLTGSRRSRGVRVVLLEGAAGHGKTRLARWLGERASEVGAALVLRAVHSPLPADGDGLAGLVHRHLRLAGLTVDEAIERVHRLLVALGVVDRREAERLVAAALPAHSDAAPFATAHERHAATLRHLLRTAQERPVLIELDDVQWGLDALGFVQHVLEQVADGTESLTFVMTVREEALPRRRTEAGLLDSLARDPRVSRVSLGPLPDGDRARLVRELLGLDGPLAEEVEQRTGGNPLFAIQLVGDWIERGILEPSPSGYRLRQGARLEFPASVKAAWDKRVARLLEALPAEAERALWVAAVLGQEVDQREWTLAAEQIGARPSRDLLYALERDGLARKGIGGGRQGWAFAHGMLRECLERRAEQRGWLPRCHAACAAMLAQLTGELRPGRIARHLLASGQLAEAVPHLSRAADHHLVLGELHEAAACLRRRDRALDSVGVALDDELRGEGWVLWSRLAEAAGRPSAAEVWAERATEAARAFDWASVRPGALVQYGRLSRQRGAFGQAWRLFDEAAPHIEALGDRVARARLELEKGRVLVEQGAHRAAIQRLRSARGQLEQLDDEVGIAEAFELLGEVARQRGRHESADTLAEWGRTRFDALGHRVGVARCLDLRGEVARSAGELDRAEAFALRALALHEDAGSGGLTRSRLNLGLADLARGDLLSAASLLRETLQDLSGQAHPVREAITQAALMVCAAHDGEWSEWDRHEHRLQALLANARFVHVDLEWVLGLAAEATEVESRRSFVAERRQEQSEALVTGLTVG